MSFKRLKKATVAMVFACAGAAGAKAQGSDSLNGRTYSLSLPVVYHGRIVGDLLVHVQPNGDAQFDRESLLETLSPLISPESYPEFERAIDSGPLISPVQLNREGIALRYDAELLQVVVENIDPSLGAVTSIGPSFASPTIPVTVEPKKFSAYLNVVTDMRYDEQTDKITPTGDFLAVARFSGAVLEIEGGYDNFASEQGFYRRSTRLIYDQIEKERRWTAGDIRQETLPVLGGVYLGGVGVEKGRRVFNQYRPILSAGPQQVTIDRTTQIDIVSNGVVLDTIELQPGNYDLSQLPLRYGSSDINLVATDGTNQQMFSSIDLFVDPYDLGRGEIEYSAALGYLRQNVAFDPDYGEELSFSGFYRRGMSNRLVMGGAAQLSADQQVLAVDSHFTPQSVPARIDISAASSTGESSGYAINAGLQTLLGGDRDVSQLSINAFYESAGFATIGESSAFSQLETLTVNGSYSRSLGRTTSMVAGMTWLKRDKLADEQSLFLDVTRNFTNGVRAVVGMEYGSGDLYNSNFGIRVGLNMNFGHDYSARSGYNSRRELANAALSKSYNEQVGDYGYEVGVRQSPDSISADVRGDYVGNRFHARAAYVSSGQSFDNFGETSSALLRLGSSIAYAGGKVGIGRPVRDSFAIVDVHKSLDGQQVIVGDQLSDENYDASSGWLGPALTGRIYSYSQRDLSYDLKNAPPGLDIGTGVETLLPPYRSGYVIEVGTDANVSIVGTLSLGGQSAELVVGVIEGVDDAKFEPSPFFTNSVGRFAAIGLRPGKTYRVTLNDTGLDFLLEVPEDGTKLVRLGQVDLALPEGAE